MLGCLHKLHDANRHKYIHSQFGCSRLLRNIILSTANRCMGRHRNVVHGRSYVQSSLILSGKIWHYPRNLFSFFIFINMKWKSFIHSEFRRRAARVNVCGAVVLSSGSWSWCWVAEYCAQCLVHSVWCTCLWWLVQTIEMISPRTTTTLISCRTLACPPVLCAMFAYCVRVCVSCVGTRKTEWISVRKLQKLLMMISGVHNMIVVQPPRYNLHVICSICRCPCRVSHRRLTDVGSQKTWNHNQLTPNLCW